MTHVRASVSAVYAKVSMTYSLRRTQAHGSNHLVSLRTAATQRPRTDDAGSSQRQAEAGGLFAWGKHVLRI